VREKKSDAGGQAKIPALPVPIGAGGMIDRNRIRKVRGILLLAFGVLLVGSILSPGAAQSPLLEEKHKNGGLSCDACHKESPPANKVATEACQGCHGDSSKLAEQTKQKKPNPHDSHEGPIACEKCHHNHKPSENYCASCHNFGFRVP
jgi:hypothetical protein